MYSYREDFFKAMRREQPERVQFYFSLCESLLEAFERKHNTRDYLTHYGVPFREVNINPTKHQHDFSGYFESDQVIDQITEWGLGLRRGSIYHFSEFISPMKNFDSVEQVLAFPLPDVLDSYRWGGLKEQVEEHKAADLITISGPDAYIDIFEPAWYLRGMENLMMDMLADEEMATACLDRILEVKCEMAKRYAELGVDVIIYGDDVGTERAMMISADLWREWLKPRLHKAIQAAKNVNPNVLCYYHSDGVINDIIPDLIEVGVDILNPIQPECMDPVEIKELYGHELSFWGTIGTQTTMPFGTPDDVRRVCSEMIEKVGKGGGLVLAPTHLLEPEVPWENIEAFVETVKSYQ